MRRFSSKNHLVTLNEINITPLLDLAFVLLIIFIITTPLLEQSLDLNVPSSGAQGSAVRKDEVRTIEVHPAGGYVLRGRTNTLAQLEQLLIEERRKEPNLAVFIRADFAEKFGNVQALIGVFERAGIKRVKFADRPQKR
jgi:biopolymer transport protein ExbD